MSKSDQKAVMKQSLARLEKKFGSGIAVQMGSKKIEPIEVFSSGSISIDLAIGDGGVNCGLPWGRAMEVFGVESGGKTTIALMFVAAVQRLGKLAVYVDAEHALDPVYAGKLGVNMKELVVCQPDYGEQGLEVAGEFISTGAASIIVIDSVAALVCKSELEGEMGDAHPGIQARMMGQFCRKFTGSTNRHQALVVFINQIREKIGVTWGSNETTAGGRAIKFGASLRLDVRRIATLKDGDRPVGNRTRVKVIKNKIAKPFKEAEFDIIFGEGVSRSGEIVDLGAKYAVIEKSGAWYNYGAERIGQGREQAKTFIKANPEIAAKIEKEIYQRAALDVI